MASGTSKGPQPVLQICPHDTPPFADLCEAIAKAGAEANLKVTTIILDQPSAAPRAGFIYLGASRANAGRLLKKHPEVDFARGYWKLVLCHRYGAFRAARKLKVPHRRIVVLAHEFDYFASFRRRLDRFIFTRRVHFGGVSPAVNAQMARHTRMGLVIPNIVDLPLFKERLLTREDALQRLGLEPHELTIAVVGRLHYKKRPEMALQAFQQFRVSHPNARLVFVGDGDRVVRQKLVDAGATVTGQIERAADTFRAFDVVLHTGDVEAFGMVVLEAMAAGIPVVAPKGGGPEYVLGELGCCPATDTPEAYAQALNDAVAMDRESYRRAALDRIEKMFSTQAMARILPSLIEFVKEPEKDPFAPIA